MGKTNTLVRIGAIVSLLTVLISSTTEAKRKESNDPTDVGYLFGGFLTGLAIGYLGDGGAGLGFGGSGDDNGFNGGGLCLYGDTFLIHRKSFGISLAGGWLVDTSRNHNDSPTNAMFIGPGCAWRHRKLRFSLGPGYAWTDGADGPILFAGVSWILDKKR